MLRMDLIASIPALLRRHAAARGGQCAYRDAQTSVTYAELHERTGKLAGHLAGNGIAANDTVAIMLPNSVQWVESCLAIARAGAISVPISYDSTETEIGYRLADANCKAVFTTAERGDLFGRLKVSAPNLTTLIVTDRGTCGAPALRYSDLLMAPPQSAPRDPASQHDTAFILYTSGTTGRAKGVRLTVHGMLWVTAACWAPITGLSDMGIMIRGSGRLAAMGRNLRPAGSWSSPFRQATLTMPSISTWLFGAWFGGLVLLLVFFRR